MDQLLEQLKRFKFILGSSSPRRREILETNLGICQIEVIPSEFPENISKDNITSQQYVTETCQNKTDSIINRIQENRINLNQSSNVILLCSDTIIDCNSQIFEKPKTKQRQKQMFDDYRKQGSIKVITAVTVTKFENGSVFTELGLEVTILYFNEKIPNSFIESYIESEEGLNVAGGFKYQEKGCLLFNRIEGDYFNIVGLPVWKTFELLQKTLTN